MWHIGGGTTKFTQIAQVNEVEERRKGKRGSRLRPMRPDRVLKRGREGGRKGERRREEIDCWVREGNKHVITHRSSFPCRQAFQCFQCLLGTPSFFA